MGVLHVEESKTGCECRHWGEIWYLHRYHATRNQFLGHESFVKNYFSQSKVWGSGARGISWYKLVSLKITFRSLKFVYLDKLVNWTNISYARPSCWFPSDFVLFLSSWFVFVSWPYFAWAVTTERNNANCNIFRQTRVSVTL
jgi:hypothetical protein